MSCLKGVSALSWKGREDRRSLLPFAWVEALLENFKGRYVYELPAVVNNVNYGIYSYSTLNQVTLTMWTHL